MLRQKLIETLDSFGAIPATDDYANGYNNCRKIIVPLIRETIDAWTKEGNDDNIFIIDTDEGNLVLSQAHILNTIETFIIPDDYKRAVEAALRWNKEYLTEVKDNIKFRKMMNNKDVSDEYKQDVICIRRVLKIS